MAGGGELGPSCHGAPAAPKIVRRGALRVTCPLRTCFDLARRCSLVKAIVLVDAALHRRLIDLKEFREFVAERSGWRGVARARRVADLALPGTESPTERI